MDKLNDSFPELKIEHLSDGMDNGLILLEQDSSGNIDRVAIHPIQLRYMAEKIGLVQSGEPQAQKTIATLQRRMTLLRDRIDTLHNYLVNHSDHRHADLSYEVTYATACLDLADEFCADFESEELEQAPLNSSICNRITDTPTECRPASGQGELL